MSRIWCFTIVTLILSIVPAGWAPAAIVVSNFDSDAEGWTVAGEVNTEIVHVPTGGDPGGYIDTFEVPGSSGIRWLAAPQTFVDELTNNVGGSFSFSLRSNSPTATTNTNTNVSQLVRIISSSHGTISIASSFSTTDAKGEPHGETWTRYSFDLTHTGGWLSTTTGKALTEQEFLDLLGDATALQIKVEIAAGSDHGQLDSVAFVPEPASLALLGMGVLCLTRGPRKPTALG